MSLLNPNQLQIHNVLRELKLPKENETISDLLEDNGLGKQEVLDTMSSLMRGADTSAVRLQAAKTALQMHGLLDEGDKSSQMIVNIIIKDSEFSVNPILVPR